MIIQIQLDNEEIDLEFRSLGDITYTDTYGVSRDGEKWASIFDGENQIPLVSFIIDGYQIFQLDYSSRIKLVEGDAEATRNLLITRIQEKLKEVIEARNSGVEYTGESESIMPLNQPKPYDPDKIKVRQDKFSVEYVVSKLIGRGIFDLNPDFQRKFVWDKKRQSNLIESIMLGIPIPVFYLAEGHGGNFHVIDGLQRLSTLRDFLTNQFNLRNLEHLSDYDGCYFNDDLGAKKVLDTKMLTRIETAQLHFNIIEASSPPEVKYDIFTRLNTGGQPLNSQEVRNCVAEEKVRNFLNRCASSDIFKMATDNSIKSRRMEDQEMVLRFTGFYLQKKGEIQYTGDMNPFLNDVLDRINKESEEVLEEIERRFINSMFNAYHLFGKYSFRKCTLEDLSPNARKQYINKSMFIAWSILLADLNHDEIVEKTEFSVFAETVAKEMQIIEVNTLGMTTTRFSEYYYLFTSSTSDKRSINNAMNKTQEIINTHLLPQLIS